MRMRILILKKDRDTKNKAQKVKKQKRQTHNQSDKYKKTIGAGALSQASASWWRGAAHCDAVILVRYSVKPGVVFSAIFAEKNQVSEVRPARLSGAEAGL